jgi:hypothetical protein
MLVKITVHRSDNSSDISEDIQKLVGYMPVQLENSEPKLGKILTVRPATTNGSTYEIESGRKFHVFVIGQTPNPKVFTFVPGWSGHSSSYQIILDQ